MPRSGTTISQVSSIFNFFRKAHTVFHGSVINLQPHPQHAGQSWLGSLLRAQGRQERGLSPGFCKLSSLLHLYLSCRDEPTDFPRNPREARPMAAFREAPCKAQRAGCPLWALFSPGETIGLGSPQSVLGWPGGGRGNQRAAAPLTLQGWSFSVFEVQGVPQPRSWVLGFHNGVLSVVVARWPFCEEDRSGATYAVTLRMSLPLGKHFQLNML